MSDRTHSHSVSLASVHLDSSTLWMYGDSIIADDLIKRMTPPEWGADEFVCELQRGSVSAAIAVGFYEFEDFGVWSRVPRPYLILDKSVSGEFVLEIEARAFGRNIDHELKVIIGDCERSLTLDETPCTREMHFCVEGNAHVVAFGGVVARSDPANDDPRSLGIGLTSLRFRRMIDLKGPEPGEDTPVTLGEGSLVGFHSPEEWGAWTSQDEAWVQVPELAPGRVNIRLDYRSHSVNEGGSMRVECGGAVAKVPLGDRWDTTDLEMRIDEPARVIRLSGWRTSPVAGSGDPRSLGIGLGAVTIRQTGIRKPLLHIPKLRRSGGRPIVAPADATVVEAAPKTFVVSIDGEANQQANSDVISSFVYAFRGDDEAMMFVVAPSSTIANVFSDVLYLLSRVGSYRCRIIVVPREPDGSVPRDIMDAAGVLVIGSESTVQPADLSNLLGTRKVVLVPQNLLGTDQFRGAQVVAVPVSLRPYRVPGERFGYRRRLVEVIEWNDLVDGMSEAGRLAGAERS